MYSTAQFLTIDFVKLQKQPDLNTPRSTLATGTTLHHNYRGLLFEYLALCGLGVTEVHYLIQELVDEHKVITNAFLLNLTKVLLEHLYISHVIRTLCHVIRMLCHVIQRLCHVILHAHLHHSVQKLKD